MQLDVPTRTRHRVSLTSLIDVIFLLLLFFMLSSTFSKYSEIEILSAKTGAGTTNAKPDLFMNLTSSELKLNGETLLLEDLPEVLLKLSSRAELKAVLKVTEHVTSQQLVDVIQALTLNQIKVTVIR